MASPAFTAYSGTARSNFTSDLGCTFTLDADKSVTALGRMNYADNFRNHTVKIVLASDHTTVIASATVLADFNNNGSFEYTNITPVTLSSGVTYALLSSEVNGEDSWGDEDGTVTPEAGVTVGSSCYVFGGNLVISSAGDSFVGVNAMLDDPGAGDTEITRHGITLTMDGTVTTRVSATGDYFVIIGASGTVNGHTQPNAVAGRDGAMLNPVGAEANGYDDRATGYSALLDAALDYPLAVSPGDSLVTTISFDVGDSGFLNPTSGTEFSGCTVAAGSPNVITRTGGWGSAEAGHLVVWGTKWANIGEIRLVDSVDGNDLTVAGDPLTPDERANGVLCSVGGALRPFLKSAVVWTFVETDPGADKFRPPPFAGATKTLHAVSDINWTNLPAVAGTASDDPVVGDFAGYEDLIERVQLDHGTNYGFNEQLRPHDNFNGTTLDGLVVEGWYPRYWGERAGDMRLALMLTDFTQAEKTPLMKYMIQMGKDLFGAVEADAQYPANGGQGWSRLTPILFAGKMLDDADMLAVRTDFPATSFGEIEHTFTITQAHVDLAVGYVSGDIGTAEWRVNTSTYNPAWDANYRDAVTAIIGDATVLYKMDLWENVDHVPLRLYIERYMAHPSTAQRGTAFSEAMYDEYYVADGSPLAVTLTPAADPVTGTTVALTSNATGGEGTKTYAHSRTSGPAAVSYSNAAVANPTVTFTKAGDYVLRVDVTDDTGTAFDEVAVTVSQTATAASSVSVGIGIGVGF